MARPRKPARLIEVVFTAITYEPIGYCSDFECFWKYDKSMFDYDPKKTRVLAKQHTEETQHKTFVDKINRTTFYVRPEDDDEHA